MKTYTLEHGSYYLRHDSGDIALMTDRVAVAYDTETFALTKHGAPDAVLAWQKDAQAKMGGLATFAVVTFPRGFDPAVLNRIIGTSQYLREVLREVAPELVSGSGRLLGGGQ